jgi:hypothetical protein
MAGKYTTLLVVLMWMRTCLSDRFEFPVAFHTGLEVKSRMQTQVDAETQQGPLPSGEPIGEPLPRSIERPKKKTEVHLTPKTLARLSEEFDRGELHPMSCCADVELDVLAEGEWVSPWLKESGSRPFMHESNTESGLRRICAPVPRKCCGKAPLWGTSIRKGRFSSNVARCVSRKKIFKQFRNSSGLKTLKLLRDFPKARWKWEEGVLSYLK